MDLRIVVLVIGGAAAVFAYLVGAAFLRKGHTRNAHLFIWGGIVVLLGLGLIVEHDWAPFLLFAAFVLVGQAATELWRIRRARNRATFRR